MAGRLFDSILIDKLRFYADYELFTNISTSDFIGNIQEVMSAYYQDNAFIIDTSRHRISLEFTPTRYKVNKGQTDTNLIMPTEQELLNLFTELGFYRLPESIYNGFIISKLHLTKNFYTQNTVPRYIKMLGDRKYKGGIKPIHNTSNATNTSLTLSTLKKDDSYKNIVGNKVIKFYDKVQELKDKASLNEVFLPEPLPIDDIKVLPKGSYSNNPPYLSLQNLHIIRCELQYATSVKLKKISDFIFGVKNSHDLRLATLLKILQNGELYNTLERFYTKELNDNVFFDRPNTTETKLSKYEKLLAELIKGKSATRLLGMYQRSQKESLSRVIRKLQQAENSNPLYTELYNKFIKGQND